MSKVNKIYNTKTSTEKQEVVPASSALPAELDNLDEETAAAVNAIVSAKTQDELTQGIALFNISQKKKNTAREMALSNLLDDVIKQAAKRFKNRPDEFSNADVLAYMNTTAAQIDRAHKIINEVDERPAIQVNSQKNEINVNIMPGIDSQESKNKVIDTVKAIMSAISSNAADQARHEEGIEQNDTPVVDVTPVEKDDSTENK